MLYISEIIGGVDIASLVLKNGGYTCMAHGGDANLTKGYCFSIKGFERTIAYEGKSLRELNEFIDSFKLEHHKVVQYGHYNGQKLYFGFWLENGLLYCDITTHTNSVVTAIREGRKNEQKAIYDCARCESIYLTEE